MVLRMRPDRTCLKRENEKKLIKSGKIRPGPTKRNNETDQRIKKTRRRARRSHKGNWPGNPKDSAQGVGEIRAGRRAPSWKKRQHHNKQVLRWALSFITHHTAIPTPQEKNGLWRQWQEQEKWPGRRPEKRPGQRQRKWRVQGQTWCKAPPPKKKKKIKKNEK